MPDPEPPDPPLEPPPVVEDPIPDPEVLIDAPAPPAIPPEVEVIIPPVPAIVIVAFVPFAAVTTGPGATGTGKDEKVGTTMLVLFAIELPLAKTV